PSSNKPKHRTYETGYDYPSRTATTHLYLDRLADGRSCTVRQSLQLVSARSIAHRGRTNRRRSKHNRYESVVAVRSRLCKCRRGPTRSLHQNPPSQRTADWQRNARSPLPIPAAGFPHRRAGTSTGWWGCDAEPSEHRRTWL